MNPEEIQLTLLSLSYERYVSRAHTIFSTFWDIFFGIMVGFLGLILSFLQIKIIEFQKYTISIIIIILLSTNGLVGLVAFYPWFESRVQRKEIVEKIKELQTTQPNQPQPPIISCF